MKYPKNNFKMPQTGGVMLKGTQTHDVRHKNPKRDRKDWKAKANRGEY